MENTDWTSGVRTAAIHKARGYDDACHGESTAGTLQ